MKKVLYVVRFTGTIICTNYILLRFIWYYIRRHSNHIRFGCTILVLINRNTYKLFLLFFCSGTVRLERVIHSTVSLLSDNLAYTLATVQFQELSSFTKSGHFQHVTISFTAVGTFKIQHRGWKKYSSAHVSTSVLM